MSEAPSKPRSGLPAKSKREVKAHCNGCLGEKNHRVLFKKSQDWVDEIADDCRIEGQDNYEMLHCCGCDRVCVRHTAYHSENTDERGRAIPTVSYYPPPLFRRMPKWSNGFTTDDGKGFSIHSLPRFVEPFLEEISISLQNRCLRAAAMTIRALLESIMIDKGEDAGSFSENLKALSEAGYIGAVQRETLSAIIDLGSATIHRGFVPKADEIETALDITEEMISAIYVQPVKAKAIRERVPARPPRPPKQPKAGIAAGGKGA